MTVLFMEAIKALGVNTVDVLHAVGEVAGRSVDEQMIMVGHKAVNRNFEIKHLTCFLRD